MPTMPPTLTPAPLSPDRADRATFSARAVALDDFVKNTHIPEVQAAINNVYANAVEVANTAQANSVNVALASAAANFKGLWSGLTGALNMPASVYHNGNYWALGANLADVTAATPGVSASWTALNVGLGGAAETTSAANITLTATSFRVQSVTMTASDLYVTLPVATTLPTGSDIFVVKNAGTTVFCVRDSAGTMIVALDPGKTVSLALVNAGSAAGVWVASGTEGVAEAMYQAVATAVNASASNSVCITPLTNTTALAVWASGGFLTAVVLTVSGTSVSVGTVFTSSIYVIGNPPRMRVTAMSATQAIVAYTSSPNSYPAAVTLNISAGVVTAGTALIFGTVATSFQDVSMLTATKAIVIYKGTSGYGETRTLNVSGTTLTAGAILVLMNSAGSPGAVVAISGTQAVASLNISGIITYNWLLTVSGTTVTAGATPAHVLATGHSISACKVSATKVLLAATAYVSYMPRYALLEVSGTTVILRDVMDGFGGDYDGAVDLVKISASKYLAVRKPAGGGSGFERIVTQIINIADSALRIVNPTTTIKNSFGSSGNNVAGVASLSATKQLVVYPDTSTYIQARILEIPA